MKKFIAMVFSFLLLIGLAACNGDAEENPVDAGNLKEHFFDLAREYRLDYAYIEEGQEYDETDNEVIKCYAFYLADYPESMTEEYIEEVAQKYYGWDIDLKGDTSLGAESGNPKPYMGLTSYKSEMIDGKKINTITMDSYSFTGASLSEDDYQPDLEYRPYEEEEGAVYEVMEAEGLSFVEAARKMISEGNTENFQVYKRRTICYEADPEDRPLRFLWVEVEYPGLE